MKNNAALFILTIISLSFSVLAQEKRAVSTTSEKVQPVTSDNPANNEDYGIVSYHVEEKVGKNVTIYNVSHFSLIETSNLGANNTRTITPKYVKLGKAKTRILPVAIPVDIATTDLTPVKNPLSFETTAPKKKRTFIMIDIISTYERILEKGGYESIEMLKKVANNRYFKGDFDLASKWYSQLFALTNDLGIEYYYRYGQSLLSVGRTEKGKEMMRVFENKRVSK